MNVLDRIRKRFDDAKRYTEKHKEENKRKNEELNMDADISTNTAIRSVAAASLIR